MNETHKTGLSISDKPTPRPGKLRYGLAMWLLGMPLPIIIIALFVKGCDF